MSNSEESPRCDACGHATPSVREWADAPDELLCVVCLDNRQEAD